MTAVLRKPVQPKCVFPVLDWVRGVEANRSKDRVDLLSCYRCHEPKVALVHGQRGHIMKKTVKGGKNERY